MEKEKKEIIKKWKLVREEKGSDGGCREGA